jgi:hypothetical protein
MFFEKGWQSVEKRDLLHVSVDSVVVNMAQHVLNSHL